MLRKKRKALPDQCRTLSGLMEQESMKPQRSNKIVDPSEIQAIAAAERAENKTIVFTNGCFDILHAGHVSYLEAAAAQGDILILGLNSDRSVKAIKGNRRPIINEQQRAEVVAALACVDHVVIFDEPDPEALIRAVVPTFLPRAQTGPRTRSSAVIL